MPAKTRSVAEEIAQGRPFSSPVQELIVTLLRTTDDVRRVLSGLIEPEYGKIAINGEPVHKPPPAGMLKRGVGRVPDDRTGTGLVADMTGFSCPFLVS